MALEDYKISDNTVMCWDSRSDGRLNALISSGSLKNNKVSAIIPQIKDFALIQGLALDGDGFKQYCRIGDSLYLMNNEVKAAREATRRAALKADPHTVVWNQVKSYLKAQGFTREEGDYEAPTNRLPDNVAGKRDYYGAWDDVSVGRESKSPEFGVFHRGNEQVYDLEGLSVKYEMPDWFRPWASDHNHDTTYPLTQQGFEEFKKDWEAYKEQLPAQLKDFFEKVRQDQEAIKSKLGEISPQALADKLKHLGYQKAPANYMYRYQWAKTYHPLEGVTLVGKICYNPRLERGEMDPKGIEVPLFPAFEVIEGGKPPRDVWTGYNRRHLYADDPKAKADDRQFSALLGAGGDWDYQAFHSVEDIDRFLGQKAVEFEKAFEDEELDSDSLELESLSIQEALRKLHRK